MVGQHVADLETPEVLVDRERLLANLKRVQRIADAHCVRLRPHIKTHKCIEIAQLQLELGAIGLTASKVDEALAFIESGVARSITLAYPIIDPRKLDRLIAACGDVDVRLIADSSTAVDAIARAARRAEKQIRVFVKVDVGLHRCGVSESDRQLVEMARRISDSAQLQFAGLLSHAGHSYGARDREEIAAIAADECAILNRARDCLKARGIEVAETSVGATPTVLAGKTFDGVTEIRPGNYAFLDGTALRLGLAKFNEIALSVIATVVSKNDRYFIIDAGSKVLSSDTGPHATASDTGFGSAFALDDDERLCVVRLSEEHGFVERASKDLPIGTKLRVFPNHACPVANLADRLTVESDGVVCDEWIVAARGKMR